MVNPAVQAMIDRATGILMHRFKFYAGMLLSTDVEEREDIETAATDMVKIYYNPNFFLAVGQEQVTVSFIHELLHKALKHGLRRAGRDPLLWNIACDHEVNLIILEEGMPLLPSDYADPKYIGWAAELIYNDLMKDQRDGRQPKRRGGGAGPKRDGDLKPTPGGPEGEAKVAMQIDQQVATAAGACRSDQMSASIRRLLKALRAPALPWAELLRDYVTETCKDEENWSVRNRRFEDVYLPGRRNHRMGELVLVADTSASITRRMHEDMAEQVRHIAELVKPTRIRIIWCDITVRGEQVFEVGAPIKVEPVGGGDTDMRVGLTYAERYDPMVVLLFTDGYTPWPTSTSYPLITICTTATPVPIGQVVRYLRS